jgi:hypothetical protein
VNILKIIFNDNTEMDCIQVNGAIRYVQGANRDTLEFVFSPELYTIADIDTAFSDPEKCKKITLQNGDVLGIHEYYTIRTGFVVQPFILVHETPTTPEVSEQRISVTMAQKNYSEMQQESLQDTVDMLVLDSLGVM